MLVNILVSILIFGYSSEMEFIKYLPADQNPLVAMVSNLKSKILNNFSGLRSLFTFQYLMAAGQPQGRVSQERLAVIEKKRREGLKICSSCNGFEQSVHLLRLEIIHCCCIEMH